ncbi:MAG: N-acetyltransferase [Bacillota bacterium]|nr:N-acetyltransferase [Bacillota bacterium]
MRIRLAKMEDLEQILRVYSYAQDFMIEHGNPNQWGHIYPEKELLEKDIEEKQLYVMESDSIHGVFVFILGEDPTYQYIENGNWLNNEEYGTIHRIASDGKEHGILSTCLAYVSSLTKNIRIDTHHDNIVMQKAILKNGFTECGIIYVADGSARIAYQKEV